MTDHEDKLGSAGEDPKRVADEQFVHGLLEFMHKDSPDRQRARMDRVMTSIDAGTGSSDLSPRVIPLRPRPNWPLIASIALPAMILISVFILSRSPSAAAIVDSALAALPELGDRRYQFVAQMEPGNSQPAVTGNLDIRDDQHMLLQAQTEDGYRLVLGRNAEDDWLVHSPEGGAQHSIEHSVHNEGWPRWLNLDAHMVLLDSVDSLLRHLHHGYSISHQDQDPSTGSAGEAHLARLVAHRKIADESAPERIDLWIDRASHTVQRMELRWPKNQLHEHLSQHQAHLGQHQAPHLVHVAPKFGAGELHAPHLLTFKLIEQPSFEPDWFDPKSHAK